MGVVLAFSASTAGAAGSAGAGAAGSNSAADTSIASAVPNSPGAFVSLTPKRILDTRSGLGASGPVAGKATVRLQVAGRGGVPSSGVSAVVLNVTATRGLARGHVRVFPDGASRPDVSNVNFASGETVANSVTVKVGSNGKVALYNGSTKSVQLVADVAGYYVSGTPTAPGAFVSLAPSRIVDTRRDVGARGPVDGRETVHVQVGGRGGVPSSGVAAVVLNLTVTETSAPSGYLTAYPTGAARPQVSHLNFGNGRSSVANLATVKVADNGTLSLYNGSPKSIELIADVAGYYRAGTATAPGMFVALDPQRILDTRKDNGASGPVTSKRTVHLQSVGRNGIRTVGVSAVAMNMTVTEATARGYVTAFPDGASRPTASNLNFVANRTVANSAIVRMGSNGKVSLYNSSSKSVELISDVAGYFLSIQLLRATTVARGSDQTCAVTTAGAVKCWGVNDSGELGNGTTTDSKVPVSVSGLSSGVKDVSAGSQHTCALTNAGGVKCWGRNKYGQLGNGSTSDSSVPVNVQGLSSGVKAIGLSFDQSCAVTTAGAVKCWGYNNAGQLGNGTKTNSSVPVNVVGLSSGVKSVSLDNYHTCAVTTGGGAKCWGAANALGNGTSQESLVPVDVLGLSSGVDSLTSVGDGTCALMTAGGVKCWGANSYGQLGDGSRTESLFPIPVSGLSAGVASLGQPGSCAILAAGGAKCWGFNADGELGNGNTDNQATPVNVVGASDPVKISTGQGSSCSVSRAGSVECWGGNYFGTLGDGTTKSSLTPKIVAGF